MTGQPTAGQPTAGQPGDSTPAEGSQRQHILDAALRLMGQRGVDGTSMRDLAAAAGLNVASLYHYFPSKRDLLMAVIQQRGFVAEHGAVAIAHSRATTLAELITEMLADMLEAQDFVRLMMGAVMRGDDAAVSIGAELWVETQRSIELWLGHHEAELAGLDGPGTIAGLVVAQVVGVFFEHLSGVLNRDVDPRENFALQAEAMARALGATT